MKDQLPDYRVRTSKRARRMRIVVHTDASVEVVVPQGVSAKMVAELVYERRVWLKRAVEKFTRQAESLHLQAFPPKQIDLKAVNYSWVLAYKPTTSSQVRVSESDGVLTMKGAVDDHDLIHQALCRWLKDQAKSHLSSCLQKLSRENGLAYQSLGIRLQKGRWGSCSHKKVINLNAKLMFLPEDMVAHVLLHELAHLKHMNHSKDFWNLLESMDADCKSARKDLRDAWTHVPNWIER